MHMRHKSPMTTPSTWRCFSTIVSSISCMIRTSTTDLQRIPENTVRVSYQNPAVSFWVAGLPDICMTFLSGHCRAHRSQFRHQSYNSCTLNIGNGTPTNARQHNGMPQPVNPIPYLVFSPSMLAIRICTQTRVMSAVSDRLLCSSQAGACPFYVAGWRFISCCVQCSVMRRP